MGIFPEPMVAVVVMNATLPPPKHKGFLLRRIPHLLNASHQGALGMRGIPVVTIRLLPDVLPPDAEDQTYEKREHTVTSTVALFFYQRY